MHLFRFSRKTSKSKDDKTHQVGGICEKRYLYYGFYARGSPNPHLPHQCLLVACEHGSCSLWTETCYHAVNMPPGADGVSRWEFNQRPAAYPGQMLLARFRLATISNFDKFYQILESTPVIQGDPTWRCRHWVKDAVELLRNDGTCLQDSADLTDWDRIWQFAFDYLQIKKRDGRYRTENVNKYSDETPTYDFVHDCEITP
jgi:hypothetical protein